MQVKWDFQLEKDYEENLQSSIQSILAKEKRDLGIFLSYYFKREGAVAENVMLKGNPNFLTKSTGNLILEFDLVHFNACLAIHEEKKDQLKIDFKINQGVLELSGPNWPERDGEEL